jgi:hypothetical protein
MPLDNAKRIALITALVECFEADADSTRRAIAGVVGEAHTQSDKGKGKRKSPSGIKRGTAGGKGGPVRQALVAFWHEGRVAVPIPELRERVRAKKHFPNDNELVEFLKKSPKVYKLHSDGTVSLVTPPKLVAVA